VNSFEGFFLGLSTGVVCLATCGPLLVPYLMGEGNRIRRNFLSLSLFLGGRLVAYLFTGLLAGIAGKTVLQPSDTRNYLIATSFIVLSLLMMLYGFHRFGEICLGTKSRKLMKQTRIHWPMMVPLIGGVVSGLNICPPFLLAITKAIETGQIAASVRLFFMFFLGTSVYFLPMPFLGFFRRQEVLKIIGKFAAILTGIYYFYMGIKLLFV
jgi:sulfite exporter TauE/SafE